MIIELPGGIQDGEGTWTKEVVLREMTGHEENILADATKQPGKKNTLKVPMRERTLQILSRCTEKIGDEVRPDNKTAKELPLHFYPHWKKAFLPDRDLAWVRLRQISVEDGDKFSFHTECPHCKEKSKTTFTVDLNDQDVKSLPLEEVTGGPHEFTLPSGVVIAWNHNTCADEEVVEKILDTSMHKWKTSLLATKVKLIDGKRCTEELLADLSKKDLAAAWTEVSVKHAFGFDRTIEVTCTNPDCGLDFEDKVPVMDHGFFFPASET